MAGKKAMEVENLDPKAMEKTRDGWIRDPMVKEETRDVENQDPRVQKGTSKSPRMKGPGAWRKSRRKTNHQTGKGI